MESHSLCCGTAISLTECLPVSYEHAPRLPDDVMKPSWLTLTMAVPWTAAVTTLAHLPQQWTARVDLLDQQHASPRNVSPTSKLARPVFAPSVRGLSPSQSP